ncbi:MAG: hypothetical protein AAF546_12000 [Verrucomicrobiota bacterium]
MPATKSNTFELKGPVVVVLMLTLTAVVGAMFIFLGPKATEKSPGVLHVGIRYTTEGSVDFLRYGKKGPDARIEFIAPDGNIPHSLDGLKIGRNLVPLENLEPGPYVARLSADYFQPIEVHVVAQGRMINPAKDVELPIGAIADYNMIGVRFLPATSVTNSSISRD